MSPIIVAEHLTKWYGPRLAIADISFAIEPGEVIGLLGPNGSGKSTILRILTGYLRPSRGTASVVGVDVLENPLEVRRKVGYVPEDVPLYNNMRVEEFLRFMAQIKGLRGKAVTMSVQRVLERLNLERVQKFPIAKLSRGFRQRVAIAQALVNNSQILILDEPTTGLDPHQIAETREFIRSVAGSHTILVASHVLAEMEKIADRVMILLEGKLLAVYTLTGTHTGCRFRLRIDGPEATVQRYLKEVPGVKTVRLDTTVPKGSPCYIVETELRDRMAQDLARLVVQKGFALAELTEVSVDLERVFLDVTRNLNQALV